MLQNLSELNAEQHAYNIVNNFKQNKIIKLKTLKSCAPKTSLKFCALLNTFNRSVSWLFDVHSIDT